MASPSQELQAALYAELVGAASVTDLVGARVYDGQPPRGAGFPRITFGPSDYVPQSFMGDCPDARLETCQIDIWSRQNGQFYEAKAITDAVEGLLNGAALTLPTHAVSAVEVTQVRVFLDADGATAHGVVQVEAMVERT